MEELWSKYKKSDKYFSENNLIGEANWFWDMYLGDQWGGLKAINSKKPVMNFIKQVVDYKSAAIGQNQMTAVFSDSKNDVNNDNVYAMLNRYWKTRWEKEDMDVKMYGMIQASGIQGDSYLYFSRDMSELIPDTSIMLADEQNPDLQNQKYVMIRIRPFISDVKAEGRENNVSESELNSISSEKNPDYLVGNKNDLEYGQSSGKCTAIIYFEKKNGILYRAKATEWCVYEPLKPVSMNDPVTGEVIHGSQLYPLVKLSCSTVPNDARGRGWVEDLIPNQIELNKTYYRASSSIANSAFPRIAFNSQALINPSALDDVGAPLEIEGNAQSINQLVSYLQGVPMTGDVFNYIDKMMGDTKQVAGASDAITGISDPTRVSGSAISEIREQSTLTLKGNVIKLKQCYEDIAKVRLDTWQTYFPDGVDVQREPTQDEHEQILAGEEIDLTEHIDGEVLRGLIPDVTIDVSLQTQATKDGAQAILDDKLDKGMITFEEWVNASDENGNVPKAKLLKIITARKENPDIDDNTGQVIQQQPVQTGQVPEQQVQQT